MLTGKSDVVRVAIVLFASAQFTDKVYSPVVKVVVELFVGVIV